MIVHTYTHTVYTFNLHVLYTLNGDSFLFTFFFLSTISLYFAAALHKSKIEINSFFMRS